ncbi:unnamed protein product [Phytophthora fragariaefolia]|uniref:Unnamed protein product n=1 Tax=Phytophthora fragariaefolia TaxID=1490495 RepID=A0A9W6TXD6_9STRA|nr:unnamed protein product [Phytophthora fragariaefolia]
MATKKQELLVKGEYATTVKTRIVSPSAGAFLLHNSHYLLTSYSTTLDIHGLLNEDDGSAEWEFDESDVGEEESDVNETAHAEEEGESRGDSDAAVAIPVTHHKLTGNAYVDGIICESGLHIIRDGAAKPAYKERGELGLFSTFFTREFRDTLQSWTNEMLKEKGKPEATVFEIDAYIGLDIAMSTCIIPLTEIKELWS